MYNTRQCNPSNPLFNNLIFHKYRPQWNFSRTSEINLSKARSNSAFFSFRNQLHVMGIGTIFVFKLDLLCNKVSFLGTDALYFLDVCVILNFRIIHICGYNFLWMLLTTQFWGKSSLFLLLFVCWFFFYIDKHFISWICSKAGSSKFDVDKIHLYLWNHIVSSCITNYLLYFKTLSPLNHKLHNLFININYFFIFYKT